PRLRVERRQLGGRRPGRQRTAAALREMFSNDELRAACLRKPHMMAMIRAVGMSVCVAGLVLCPVPGSSQTTLDDLVIRGFDIDVSMSPVPLKYDTVGGQRRYAARGTLRGTTKAMLEVTAPSTVSTARFFFY